jgi:hypothetical protein
MDEEDFSYLDYDANANANSLNVETVAAEANTQPSTQFSATAHQRPATTDSQASTTLQSLQSLSLMSDATAGTDFHFHDSSSMSATTQQSRAFDDGSDIDFDDEGDEDEDFDPREPLPPHACKYVPLDISVIL